MRGAYSSRSRAPELIITEGGGAMLRSTANLLAVAVVVVGSTEPPRCPFDPKRIAASLAAAGGYGRATRCPSYAWIDTYAELTNGGPRPSGCSRRRNATDISAAAPVLVVGGNKVGRGYKLSGSPTAPPTSRRLHAQNHPGI